MDITTIKNATTRVGFRGALLVRKHSPIILTSVGILGGITSAVMGAKATLKLEDTVADTVSDVEDLKLHPTKTQARDLAIVYTRGAIKVTKLYAPAASLGLASIGCVIGAHGIMQKRNVAMVAAYSALEKGFSEYRKRVEDVVGVEGEREFRYGVSTDVDKNDETGEVQVKTIFDPNGASVYARFFDELNVNWSRSPEQNKMFLRSQQNYANDKLHARGHLFLNEVYDMLAWSVPRPVRSSAGS